MANRALERHTPPLSEMASRRGHTDDVVDDAELVRRHYRFLRSDAEAREAARSADAGERLAAQFEATLAKDLAIVDLSRASFGRVGLRWRSAGEVAAGKGERVCAAQGCTERRPLAPLELPFAWKDGETARVALVSTMLCTRCAARTVAARAVSCGIVDPGSAEAGHGEAGATSARGSRRRRDSGRTRRWGGAGPPGDASAGPAEAGGEDGARARRPAPRPQDEDRASLALGAAGAASVVLQAGEHGPRSP